MFHKHWIIHARPWIIKMERHTIGGERCACLIPKRFAKPEFRWEKELVAEIFSCFGCSLFSQQVPTQMEQSRRKSS